MEANWKYCKTCIDVTYDSTKIFLKEIFKLTKLKLDFFSNKENANLSMWCQHSVYKFGTEALLMPPHIFFKAFQQLSTADNNTWRKGSF